MMSGNAAYVRRQSLRGWIRWMPTLSVLIGIICFDTWLSTETRRHDYETAKLKAHIQELRKSKAATDARIAGLETLDRLTTAAPDLGLVEPNPDQIETLYFTGALEELMAAPQAMKVARNQEPDVEGATGFMGEISSAALKAVARAEATIESMVAPLRPRASAPVENTSGPSPGAPGVMALSDAKIEPVDPPEPLVSLPMTLDIPQDEVGLESARASGPRTLDASTLDLLGSL